MVKPYYQDDAVTILLQKKGMCAMLLLCKNTIVDNFKKAERFPCQSATRRKFLRRLPLRGKQNAGNAVSERARFEEEKSSSGYKQKRGGGTGFLLKSRLSFQKIFLNSHQCKGIACVLKASTFQKKQEECQKEQNDHYQLVLNKAFRNESTCLTYWLLREIKKSESEKALFIACGETRCLFETITHVKNADKKGDAYKLTTLSRLPRIQNSDTILTTGARFALTVTRKQERLVGTHTGQKSELTPDEIAAHRMAQEVLPLEYRDNSVNHVTSGGARSPQNEKGT